MKYTLVNHTVATLLSACILTGCMTDTLPEAEDYSESLEAEDGDEKGKPANGPKKGAGGPPQTTKIDDTGDNTSGSTDLAASGDNTSESENRVQTADKYAKSVFNHITFVNATNQKIQVAIDFGEGISYETDLVKFGGWAVADSQDEIVGASVTFSYRLPGETIWKEHSFTPTCTGQYVLENHDQNASIRFRYICSTIPAP